MGRFGALPNHKDRHKKDGIDAFTSLDEIIHALEGLAADPSSVKAGRIIYHTGHKGVHVDDGSAIRDLAFTHNVFKPAIVYDSVIQGTWSLTDSSSVAFGCYLTNSPVAQNDELQYKFSHRAGTYTFVIIGQVASNKAIVTVSIDGVSQGTIDFYAAGALNDQIKTLAITIVTDGEHTLNLKCATKHASSSNYSLLFQAWWIRS